MPNQTLQIYISRSNLTLFKLDTCLIYILSKYLIPSLGSVIPSLGSVVSSLGSSISSLGSSISSLGSVVPLLGSSVSLHGFSIPLLGSNAHSGKGMTEPSKEMTLLLPIWLVKAT